MVNDKSKCAFQNCDEIGTRKRQHHRDGCVYRYCADHDPLEDENAAFRFAEVDG